MSFILYAFISFSQKTLSAETKKFVVFDDSIILFKDALMIDGTGALKIGNAFNAGLKSGDTKWIEPTALAEGVDK